MRNIDETGTRLERPDSDTETGLYYNRARYYDPNVGRFFTEDPVHFRGGVNFYRYVWNNPANLGDPFGLLPSASCACKVAAGALAGGAVGGKFGGWVGGALGGIGGALGGGAGGTFVEPGGGTVVGGVAGAIGGAAVGSRAGTAAGAAIGALIGALIGAESCENDRVHCILSGEFQDPSVDPKYKMCSYSCSDKKARVLLVPIGVPCIPAFSMPK
jgi:RHS repeat-associated protein